MFKRLMNVIKGFFALFVGGIEKQSPEALLALEKENLREQISKYNRGLASHAALVERIMLQQKKQQKAHDDLKAKMTAHLRAGNQDAAASYALRYQEVSTDLTETKEQLVDGERTYKDLTMARDQAVKAARAKIQSLAAGISDMKIKKATAEMNEMAASMISDIGGAGDTLNRLEEMVEEQRAEASGRARVARDALDMRDLEMREVEDAAMAKQALADFAAAEGLSLGGDAAPAPSESESGGKQMGPGPVAESE